MSVYNVLQVLDFVSCGLETVIDIYATPGNVNNSSPYLARLDCQKKRFKLKVEAVGLDAGYSSARIAKGLEDRGIRGAWATWRRLVVPPDETPTGNGTGSRAPREAVTSIG